MNKKLLGTLIVFAAVIAIIYLFFGIKKNVSPMKSMQEFKPVNELINKGKLDEAKKVLGDIKSEKPDTPRLGSAYYILADSYEKIGSLVKARDIYKAILNEYQNVENILEIQERLSSLNIKILFSNIITEDDIKYEVAPGDTLTIIAKKFGTTIDLIKRSNSLKDDTIRLGSVLKISNVKYKILVDRSQNILTLFSDKENVIKIYKISTGENNCTPVGDFRIVNKIKNPVWYTEGAIVPPESPDNILGSRWLGISEKGYGIHGTTAPEDIGKQTTKGCIRMSNSDVEELYTIVSVNTEVTVVD